MDEAKGEGKEGRWVEREDRGGEGGQERWRRKQKGGRMVAAEEGKGEKAY